MDHINNIAKMLTEDPDVFKTKPGGWYTCSENQDTHKTGFDKLASFEDIDPHSLPTIFKKIFPKDPEQNPKKMYQKLLEHSDYQFVDIWVSDYPVTGHYGFNCYKVKVPKDSFLLGESGKSHSTSGYAHTDSSVEVTYMHYLCWKPLPPKSFRKMKDKFLDEWEVL